jgi:hypothetical protein
MKKQTGTDFSVNYDTQIIAEIKRNNLKMELLDNIQEIIEKMGGIYSLDIKPLANDLIYKDAEGNEINQYDFWDSLYKWVNVNQDFLYMDSKEKLDKLNNPKKRKAA